MYLVLGRGRDAVDNRISIDLLPLVFPAAVREECSPRGFDTELFYASLLTYSERAKIGNLLELNSKDLLNIPVGESKVH